MECSEYAGPCCKAFFKVPYKYAVGSLCVFGIGIFAFFGKCVPIEPFQKLTVHSDTSEAILRRMNMEVSKSGDDYFISALYYFQILKFIGNSFIYSF